MLIALLAFLGGMLTIVSPCILPVLPFVFARADRSFTRGALPLLAGMALTFAVVATLAAVGGSWAVRANEVGPLGGLGTARLVRSRAGFPGALGSRNAPAGRARLAVVGAAATEESHRVVARARRGHRPAVGAVRRADPRDHLHRRRHPGSKPGHDPAAPGLCARRGDLARARSARRRQGLFPDEGLASARPSGSAGRSACW